MAPALRYRINTVDVVYEVIEGEAVIVNMSNGMYYSIDNAGATIWERLAAGATAREIIAALAAQYSGDAAEFGPAVEDFIADLQAEQLIVTATDSSAAPDPGAPAAVGDAPRPRFEAPLLQKYTDMEDLLLLDPIHRVQRDAAAVESQAGG